MKTAVSEMKPDRCCASLLRLTLLAVSAAILAVTLRAQPLVVSEIMYHPPGTNALEEWFELYNGGTNPVALSNWQVTKGVAFTFPTNTLLAAGGYLVVAADGPTFSNKHPGVTNVVAGWVGTLSHSIELADNIGHVVNSVEFYNEGDWAVRVLGPVVYNHQGWEWLAEHDGLGMSLELINPGLPNVYAHNWNSSATIGGTPGRANSVATSNAPPFVLSVVHSPVIPQPTDPVTVTARIVDEHSSGIAVTLTWRVDGDPGFQVTPMSDDGAHGDGLPNDGIFGAILPARPDKTVVEFFLEARDLENHLRTYPAVVPSGVPSRTANLLYQVDSDAYAGNQPVYRILMTEAERAELHALGRKCPDSDSDAAMNATWITIDGVVSDGTTTQLRYNAGVRNRGHGTRQSSPNNYHVDVPSDRLWKKQAGINLNSQYTHSHLVGSAIFRRLLVPMPDSRAVQVRVNSTNLMSLVLPDINSFGSYAANEQYNGDFIKRSFPLDSHGNSYRGIRDAVLCDATHNGVADLLWHGPDFAVAGYTNAYFKENNLALNDWSDLIGLIGVLNVTNGTTTATYATDVQRVLNVDEWMRYLAVNTLLGNAETCLANGYGDDYGLYRGTNDTRFLALPYDLDSVMGRGLTPFSPRDGILRMTNLPAMDRFLKTPEFAPVYYRWLKTLAETSFSSAQMDPLLEQLLNGFVPQATIDTMKAFNASHVAYVLSQIPLSLVVSNNLPIASGYPLTTLATVSLEGSANTISTRSVLVNGLPATYVAWQGAWTISGLALSPGLNRVLVQALGTNGVEVARTNHDVWYDDGSVQTVGGTISANTTWPAAGGPYSITSTLTIASGATLTLEPGTTLYLASGVNFDVANGGRLLAEGTASAPIRFTVAPGSGVSWGGMTIHGGVGSPETRIANAYFEGNSTTCIEVAGGTIHLDHTTFGTTTHQYLALDGSSFVLNRCIFPTSTAPFELVHGTGGIKTGGHGVVRECFFGSTTGYNDIMDFTGGNRDLGQPIIQYLNNVFVGASDDELDLDGTDAWIEGNIFLHVHKNGAPDSSSAISGGNTGADTSEITAVGNIFFDCDQAATAKQGNFFALINNTMVHTTKTGGLDTASAIVNVQDRDPGPPTTFGRGYYLEGNAVVDTEGLVRNYDPAQTTVTWSNNILPVAWTGPGGNNRVADPLLKYIPQLTETFFNSWEQAQIMREWLSLQSDSPARGSGPNGRDVGGVVPLGASISGAPTGTNNQTTATLTVGVNRTGNGIPTPGFPNGSGYTAYKWRLDSGAWSGETPISAPITLAGLTSGAHHVEVSGKRDSGWYQDDPIFGAEALVTTSRTWIVDPTFVPPAKPRIRINEVLARNVTAFNNSGTFPDMIELYNDGAVPVDLVDMSLSDSATTPRKFVFPVGTPSLAPGAFLVLYADNTSAAPGIHLGFSLKPGGDNLHLHDKSTRGGALIDSVMFGIQLADRSIGRMPSGEWALCMPTFGAGNVNVTLGDFRQLKINEWLADAQFAANNDFVELFNPTESPSQLGGLFFSDAAGAPTKSPIPPLSFIGGGGFTSFVADGSTDQGADHLAFKLSPDVGLILLSAPDLTLIDAINYGPQRTDVSEGRSPSGGGTLTTFAQPTSRGPNPGPAGVVSVTNITQTVVSLLEVTDSTWHYNNGGVDIGTVWRATNYSDAAWSSGFGLFGFETTPQIYPYPFRTTVPAPDQASGRNTVYYRAHFQWDGSLDGFSLISTNYVDDGAVFYLNGFEVARLRIAAGPVSYATNATASPEPAFDVLMFATNHLVVGDNVMAVEVHQANATSSDDVFGMSLAAVHFTTNVITQTFGVPIVLNEVLARNQTLTNLNGHTADWIEIYNPSTNTVDLSDLSLSNDANQPRKWVIQANTTVGPAGYLIVYCDDTSPASRENTGFGLGAKGDSVFLFHRPAAGGALLDGVSFGLQTPDFSIGRFPNGSGTWALTEPSPAAPNSAAGLGSISSLRVNEWMADPSGGSDWFEICNTGNQPVALGGLFLTDDLAVRTQSLIPPLSFIGNGANAFIQFLADGSPNSGADHTTFNLKKSGEAVAIYSAAQVLIDAVHFGAQQTGVSEGRFPDGSANVVAFNQTASPAGSNFLPVPAIVVNELLAHTDPPFEDAIEFHNAGVTAVNIGGWYLSNTQEDLKKYRIANGTILPAGGFKVFFESQFNPTNGSSIPFTFNSAHGDAAYLSEADAGGNLSGYRTAVKFGAAANGVSFGRLTNSVGTVEFVAMSARSFGMDNPATVDQFRTGAGAANPYPLVGPVVINEIMYQSAGVGGSLIDENTAEEFIELRNIAVSSIPLFDPQAPTNTWKLDGGVSFTFPQYVTVTAGGYLLLVNFDPVANPGSLAAFRGKYGVATNVPVYGPYSGNLNNTGESIQLFKPDPPQLPPHPDAGFVPFVLVEQVNYSALLPWPVDAAGAGDSLQRKAGSEFGDDPANWMAAVPTAAGANGASTPGDADGDGLSDAWEIQYFGSTSDPRATPGVDSDGDGLNNLQEYLAGTSPIDPGSVLAIDLVNNVNGTATLQIGAVAGRTYTILYRDEVAHGSWLKLVDVPAQAANRVVAVNDVNAGGVDVRFYRVVTPAQP